MDKQLRVVHNHAFALGAVIVAIALGAAALVQTYDPHLSAPTWLADTGSAVSNLAPFPVAFILGVALPWWGGLVAASWLVVAVELNQGYLNPFVIVIVIGPWLVGAITRDRQRLVRELAETSQRLQTNNEQLAHESIRYERTRIARELHDIVAHCVSVMVIQADAGQRLTRTDPRAAAQSMDHICAAAAQAQLEIGYLVNLLGNEHAPADHPGSGRDLRAGIAELAAAARATGLDVDLIIDADTDAVPAARTLVAHRVVQESITNALKHAPGSPITIHVHVASHLLSIHVRNVLTRPAPSPSLNHAGGGLGLNTMHERTSAIGGTFNAGPTSDGGWQVSAQLPLDRNLEQAIPSPDQAHHATPG
jgi:signal transduction histidine kinase